MIEVTVTLHSAITGKSSPLGRIVIGNDGPENPVRGDPYAAQELRRLERRGSGAPDTGLRTRADEERDGELRRII